MKFGFIFTISGYVHIYVYIILILIISILNINLFKCFPAHLEYAVSSRKTNN